MNPKRLFLSVSLLLFTLVTIGCSYQDLFPNAATPALVDKTIEFVATQFTPQVEKTTTLSDLSPTKTATIAPKPSSTTTQAVCSHRQGQVEFREIITTLSTHPLAFRVYLPPCYDFQMTDEYPVLYLLHGQGFKDDQWDRLGVDEIADQLIFTEEFPHFIIVMPWESNSFEDDKTSIYGELLIEELIPWVDEEYRTCDLRECRAIGGISRGAAWAMRLGLTQWQLFSAIGAHSYAPFPGDFYNVPIWIKEIPEGELPKIYMDMGSLDFMLNPAGLFEDRLTDYAVPHEWIINKGSHNEEYWTGHVEDYLYWYTFPWKKFNSTSEQ